jgi:hypothetical protein
MVVVVDKMIAVDNGMIVVVEQKYLQSKLNVLILAYSFQFM